MQEIKKRTIVIASILKPVDDTRMYGKMAQSLTPKSEVHVIGFPIKSPDLTTQHALYQHPFKRLSLKRFFAPCKFFGDTIKLKPTDLIICTHELLLPGVFLKILLGCRLFYDVQENYYRNIIHTPAFPKFLRPILATYVRVKEWCSAPFIDHYFLAEASYQTELPFLRKKYTIIENKYKVTGILTVKKNASDKNFHFIFSGTLAQSTGVFIAIDLACKLHQEDPSVFLTIIGYAARKADYDRIVSVMKDKPFIKLIGGNQLVTHAEIIEHIKSSDAGIIAYPPNPSTAGSIPTKLFEYMGNHLPILLINTNPEWVKFCESYHAAVLFDPLFPNPTSILEELKTNRFYTTSPTEVFWESEEPKLLRHFL